MRRLSLSLVLVVLITAAIQADTIHLKNGSVLKGKVTSFADEQFTVMIDTGSGRYLSRATVYVGDVARVEFDAAAGGVPETAGPREEQPREPEPAPVQPSIRTSGKDAKGGGQPQVKEPEPTARDTQPPAEQPKEPAPQPKETTPIKEPETSTSQPPATAQPPVAEPEQEKPSKKSAGPVRTVSIDVVGKRDWTSSGLIVKRGDRIRINATGTVTLDPGGEKNSGPEGIPDLPDPKKLMPEQPTGALIGVIGADNDDFIFIGKSTEFTAARDGLLFLSVNEGTLADNSGTYHATIEVQSKKPQQ